MTNRFTKALSEILHIEHYRVINIGLFIYDALAVNAAFLLALWFRFDGNFARIPEVYLNAFRCFTPFYTIACLAVFAWCRMYKSLWQYASFAELAGGMMASGITFVIQVVGITAFFGRMPLTYYCFGIILQFLFTMGIRFSYRIFLIYRRKQRQKKQKIHRVMLIGAGEAGQLILRDVQKNPNAADQIVCVIDDNSNKWNRFIEGIPIVGGREDILVNVEKYEVDRIYFAVPSASAETKREILNICSETSCELKQLPSLQILINAHVTVDQLQNVSVEDLLGRDPIRTDMKEVFEFLTDRVILVTGGGGSIGSELCRQIAAHRPRQLIIFDVYENNAYDIQLELRDKYPEMNLVTLIGSVRDSRKLDQIFRTYRPEIVYHAAAHKHVPLMEDSPCEAIKNNAIGTYKTAYAAMTYGCRKFVLISTDKAVNPTNIMGASKRLCEMVIQAFDQKIRAGRPEDMKTLYTHAVDETAGRGQNQAPFRCETEFVAVRFGNVLGSNGSVIPIFKRQIAAGGPVTVTHPDIIRYFMTIPEAVSLVLLAGTYAKGGEIFVLDMGSPVKIDTLARNLIKQAGLKPDVDIRIEYTGLRPGEKLYEEKLMEEEGLQKTDNDLIHIGNPIPFETDEFLEQLQKLMDAAYDNDENIRSLVEQVVKTYHPAGANGSEQRGAVYEKLVSEMQEQAAERAG